MKSLKLTPLSMTMIILSACGGGGGGGGSDEPEYIVSESNLDATVTAAIVGAENGVQQAPPFSVPFVSSSSSSKSHLAMSKKLGDNALVSAIQKADLEFDCAFGGSQTISLDDSLLEASSIPSSGEMDIVYDMCAELQDFTIDGDMNISWSGGWDETLGPRNTVSDFQITYFITDIDPFSLDAVVECSNYGEVCEQVSQTVIDSGVSYEISEVTVTGDVTTGFDLDANVERDGGNEIQISGNDLIPCETAGFSSGTLDITDDTNTVVVTIEFLSCDQAEVTFNNETTVVAY